jgi:phage gp46-like protein
MSDFVLNKQTFDLQIENGLFKIDNDIDTDILYGLLLEARADATQVTTKEYRGGWVGDVLYNVPTGSFLWFLTRQLTINPSALAEIQTLIQNKLNTILIAEGRAKSLNVKVYQKQNLIYAKITIDNVQKEFLL